MEKYLTLYGPTLNEQGCFSLSNHKCLLIFLAGILLLISILAILFTVRVGLPLTTCFSRMGMLAGEMGRRNWTLTIQILPFCW